MKKQNIVKKFFALALASVMTLSLCACKGGDAGKNDGKTFKVGICNYVNAASLNQINENI